MFGKFYTLLRFSIRKGVKELVAFYRVHQQTLDFRFFVKIENDTLRGNRMRNGIAKRRKRVCNRIEESQGLIEGGKYGDWRCQGTPDPEDDNPPLVLRPE